MHHFMLLITNQPELHSACHDLHDMFVIENLLLCMGLTKTVNSETNFGMLCLITHTRDLQWTPEDLDLQRKVKKDHVIGGRMGFLLTPPPPPPPPYYVSTQEEQTRFELGN